jgi:threonine aldolase
VASGTLHHFLSDNAAGICPDAWQALAEANAGYAPGYGDDQWTARATDLVRSVFEFDCDVYFTFNGTAANALSLATLCQPYHSVICHEYAHVETDECGAPEFFSNGTKVLTVGGPTGKMDPAQIERMVLRRTDVHYPKPAAVSITQPTEVGTTYKIGELEKIAEVAKRHGLRVHMDGARFANAVASLNVAPKEITWKRGIDVLCLGGTKLGMTVGDAVVFFNRELGAEFGFRCKQAGQLASKMRFLAAPWVRMLEQDRWLEVARHANRCARSLSELLCALPGVEAVAPVEANAVFVRMPEAAHRALAAKGWSYYTFIGEGGARLMCSWQTTDADIARLVADVRAALQ